MIARINTLIGNSDSIKQEYRSSRTGAGRPPSCSVRMHGSHRRLERFQILPTQRTPPTFYFLEHLHLQPVHRRRYSELLTTPHDLAADVVNFAFPLAHDNVAEVAGAHLGIALRLAVRHAVERGVRGG